MNSSALFPLSLNGILDTWYSSLDQPIPSPQIVLPSDRTSSVANLLANITGLWNSVSITDVPSVILFVFPATWTHPDLMKRWWGPKGFTSPYCKIDFRVGGKFLNCMRSPEGKEYWSTGVYREIVPLERIVCTDSFADEKGNVVPATQYGMSADIHLEMLVTVTFEEHEGKTTLTLQHVGIPAGEERDGA